MSDFLLMYEMQELDGSVALAMNVAVELGRDNVINELCRGKQPVDDQCLSHRQPGYR